MIDEKRLILLAGLSGSGKSVALNMLEDLGFHTVDNLPITLIRPVVDATLGSGVPRFSRFAIGVDPKSEVDEFTELTHDVATWRNSTHGCLVAFLLSDEATLLRRYSATRRRHPLADRRHDLRSAISAEREILAPLSDLADVRIDTTRTNVHELRELVRELVAGPSLRAMTLLVQSFSYRSGIPLDADLVFDVRCLPNPHWEEPLRMKTGLDQEVIDYLERHNSVSRMESDLRGFLGRWIPAYTAANRSYLNVSIGCTGGRHRSVFMAERLAAQLAQAERIRVLVKHQELGNAVHEAAAMVPLG